MLLFCKLNNCHGGHKRLYDSIDNHLDVANCGAHADYSQAKLNHLNVLAIVYFTCKEQGEEPVAMHKNWLEKVMVKHLGVK